MGVESIALLSCTANTQSLDTSSVSVRVRPLNRAEAADGASSAWRIDGNTIAPRDVNASGTRYALDHVFGPEWTTQQVYNATAHTLVHKIVAGFNGTVFAYGQTSSGKTFSMRGAGSEPGLIPLAVQEVFDLIGKCSDREFLLRVSYMEVRMGTGIVERPGPQENALDSHPCLHVCCCCSCLISTNLPLQAQGKCQTVGVPPMTVLCCFSDICITGYQVSQTSAGACLYKPNNQTSPCLDHVHGLCMHVASHAALDTEPLCWLPHVSLSLLSCTMRR